MHLAGFAPHLRDELERCGLADPLVVDPSCPFALEGRWHLSPTRQILSMPPRPGAFAGLVRVPERNVVSIPDDMPFEHAALAEPVVVSWHAVRSVIVHLGLLPGADGLDVRKLTLQEITFTGSCCYTPADFQQTADALARRQLGALGWTEQRPLSQGAAAFAAIDAGIMPAAKIVLRPE